ncbi:MAG: hypothetical protein GW763_15375 [Paraglaciecola sp.]|nr:hypothetical protein [Paraglaciecola sp.]NCT49332.1 hypothetical protein [Paraglaciecola sp.]
MLFVMACTAVIGVAHAEQTIRYYQVDPAVDGSAGYFPTILQMAMDKSTEKYGPAELRSVKVDMEQQRQFVSLNNNILDVM